MGKPDAIAFIDEAGAKGLVRGLTPNNDTEFGVLAALVVPTEKLRAVKDTLSNPFEQFKKKTNGQIKKLHVTDAAAIEDLRPMVEEVRRSVFAAIQQHDLQIVYSARRMLSLRLEHEEIEKIRSQATNLRANSEIALSDHPDPARVESDLMVGLVLRLDDLAEESRWKCLDIHTDRVDVSVKNQLDSAIEKTESIGHSMTQVKGFHLSAGKPVVGQIEIRVVTEMGINVKNIGVLKVLDHVDEMTFAADVVVNALNHHLRGLPNDAPLMAFRSIKGWEMSDRVYGVSDSAWEDRCSATSDDDGQGGKAEVGDEDHSQQEGI